MYTCMYLSMTVVKIAFFAIPKLKYVYLNVIVLRMKFDNIP